MMKFILKQNKQNKNQFYIALQQKQIYMNPQTQVFPNLQLVKRQIQYQNYKFNQQQINRKHQKLKRFKSEQQEQQTILNHKALYELENQKYREIKKKYTVQNILQNQYEKQIDIRRRIKTQEKSVDKIYSEQQKLMLESYQRSRMYDLGKIYKIGTDNNRLTNSFDKYQLSKNINGREDQNKGSQTYNLKYQYNKPKKDLQELYIPDSLQPYRKQGKVIDSLKSGYDKKQLQNRLLTQKNRKESSVMNQNFNGLSQRKQGAGRKDSHESTSKYDSSIKIQNVGQQRQSSKQQKRQQQKRKKSLRSQLNHVQYKKSQPQIQTNLRYEQLKQAIDQQTMKQKLSVASLQNSRLSRHSPANLQYSDYLKKQIQRKNKQRQMKKQMELEKDKQYIDRQTKAYKDAVEEMKYKKEKRKWEYALGLQKQIKWKQQKLGTRFLK